MRKPIRPAGLRPEARTPPTPGVTREASADVARRPPPEYFTLYLLQELLSSIGLRQRH